MLGHRGCRLGITYPRDLRDAGARDLRGGLRRRRGRRRGGGARGHDPAGRARRRELTILQALVDRTAGAGLRREGPHARLPRRHDDRAAARRADGRRDRRGGAVLLVRHQRPDADDARARAATTPARFLAPTSSRASIARDPFVSLDVDGVGQLVAARGRARPGDAARPQARHLRRARRRPAPASRSARSVGPRLRQRLALPRADRPARRGPGGAEASVVRRAGRARKTRSGSGSRSSRPRGPPRRPRRQRPRGRARAPALPSGGRASEHVAEALRPRSPPAGRASGSRRSSVRLSTTGSAQPARWSSCAARANVDLGWMPGRRTLAVRRQHGPAQRRQAAGADETGDRQPARRKRLAHMDQRAGKVVDRVERARAGDEIERAEGVGLFLVEPLARFGRGHFGSLAFERRGQPAVQSPTTSARFGSWRRKASRSSMSSTMSSITNRAGSAPCCSRAIRRRAGDRREREKIVGGAILHRLLLPPRRANRARMRGMKLAEAFAPLVDLVYPPRCPRAVKGSPRRTGCASPAGASWRFRASRPARVASARSARRRRPRARSARRASPIRRVTTGSPPARSTTRPRASWCWRLSTAGVSRWPRCWRG